MTAMLSVQHVKKAYGGVSVLRDVTLDVDQGQVVCVLGSSGAGKSTLMRCVAHLEPVDAGTISVEGQLVGYERRGNHLHEIREAELCRQRRGIGMVFQHFNLFGHLTALDNITLGPRKVLGLGRGKPRPRRAISWLRWVSATTPPPIPASCPAVSSSVWRSPARSRCTPG